MGRARGPIGGTLVAAVALLGAVAVFGCVQVGAASAADYDAYVACGKIQDAAPAHRCDADDRVGAFFRSNVGDVIYDVCVTFSTGREACARDQRAADGVLYYNRISAPRGSVRVRWEVEGRTVARWSAYVRDPRPTGPKRRTCGLLPGDGAFYFVKTVGIRCRAGKKIAQKVNRRFCDRHNECRQSGPSGQYRGRQSYRGWSCRVRNGWEFLQVKCRKGKRRIHAEAGA